MQSARCGCLANYRQKYTMVCGAQCRIPSPPGLPQGPTDPRLQAFASLYEGCHGYPEGLGYYCASDGSLNAHPPLWPLFGDFLYIRQYCNMCCWCEELSPEAEQVAAGTAAGSSLIVEGCTDETNAYGNIVANECAQSAANPLRTDNIGCNPSTYGRPSDSDCQEAIKMVTAGVAEPLQVREFLGLSGISQQYRGFTTVPPSAPFVHGRSYRLSSKPHH